MESKLHSKTRVHVTHSFWDGKRKPFTVAVVSIFMLLQILFFGNMSYLYGSLHNDSTKFKAFKVLMVDFDQGIIGQSLAAAYEELKGATFPTIYQKSTDQYLSAEDLVDAVHGGNYWAAVYTHPGASERLAAALNGGSAAAMYNASDAMTYVWNEARYPAFSESAIAQSMTQLVAATRIAYNQINGTQAFSSIQHDDRTAIQVFLNPIDASTINLQPTTQGGRILLNTVSMVMPIIQQFFFLMALNAVSSQFRLHSKLPLTAVIVLRAVLSVLYTLAGSLAMAGYYWTFRENWNVSGGQFALTWMILWLYMHLNFVVIDAATAFIPMSFLPFFILTWVIINVTSSIAPFEINAGFYRWSYALPAHECYQVMVDIWSRGALPKVHIALPIMFSWEVVGTLLAITGNMRRCHVAAKDEMESETDVNEKGDADASRASTVKASSSDQGDDDGDLESVHSPERRLTQEEALENQREIYGPSCPIPFSDRLYRACSNSLLSRQ